MINYSDTTTNSESFNKKRHEHKVLVLKIFCTEKGSAGGNVKASSDDVVYKFGVGRLYPPFKYILNSYFL